MLTCRRCKTYYGEFRAQCPTCGLERPRKYARVREPKPSREWCEVCDRAIRAASNRGECEVCGAIVCRRCGPVHLRGCERRELELELADFADMAAGRGIYDTKGETNG